MYLQLLLEGTLALHRCDSISTSSLSRSVGPRRDARRQKERERERPIATPSSLREWDGRWISKDVFARVYVPRLLLISFVARRLSLGTTSPQYPPAFCPPEYRYNREDYGLRRFSFSLSLSFSTLNLPFIKTLCSLADNRLKAGDQKAEERGKFYSFCSVVPRTRKWNLKREYVWVACVWSLSRLRAFRAVE